LAARATREGDQAGRDTVQDSGIEGFVAPGFEAAREAFAANFAREGDYQEVGASFSAFHRGHCVVDLWGGLADPARAIRWTRGTLANVWSSTKGIVAVAVALCVERGLIRYEDRIANVWPEFAAGGKDDITLAHVMSHQAGLPGFAEPTTVDDQLDWNGCCEKLARQSPQWPAGGATSYHAMTYGWLAGEVVRRIAGTSIGHFIRDHIARPLDASLHVGLPDTFESHVARMVAPKRLVDTSNLPIPASARMALENPQQDPLAPNRRPWRAAEIPAANGQANAMALARLYASLLGASQKDVPSLLPKETVALMTRPVAPSGRQDMFLGFVDSWGLGLAINTPGIYGPNRRAFGHSGWGGSFGCADPDAEVSIGYVCNQMGPELVGDPRTQGLCNAVIGCATRL
jgi:CubicO group peptidase (beta-lactamase class C family)